MDRLEKVIHDDYIVLINVLHDLVLGILEHFSVGCAVKDNQVQAGGRQLFQGGEGPFGRVRGQKGDKDSIVDREKDEAKDNTNKDRDPGTQF